MYFDTYKQICALVLCVVCKYVFLSVFDTMGE